MLQPMPRCALRDINTRLLQEYFTQLTGKKLTHESQDKIRDVMSAVLRSAVDYGLLIRNPIEKRADASGSPWPPRGHAPTSPLSSSNS